MNADVTMTVRFRWWVEPLGKVLSPLLILIGVVTPRSWHPRIINGVASILARYGAVMR